MSPPSQQTPRFSVIVPTAGRVDCLARCLERLARVDPPAGGYEVLVADTAAPESQPAVARAVEEFRDKVPALRYLALPAEGLMLGRHRGAQEARGEILCFIDDDSFVSPSWLRGIAAGFDTFRADMVGGPNLPLFETPPPAWLEYFWSRNADGRFLLELSLLDYGEEPKEVPHGMIWGCNFAIAKKVFHEAGGSHPDCMPGALQRFQGDGESALAVRVAAARGRAVYHPQARIEHFVSADRPTREYFRRRGFYQGVCESFTEIRRAHGLGPREGVAEAPPRPLFSPRDLFWRAQSRFLDWAGASCSLRRANANPYPEYLAVRHAGLRGLRAGRRFHQREVRRDPELLRWVLRKDFLGPKGIPCDT